MLPIKCSYHDSLLNSISELSKLAFEEDIPTGDITSKVLNINHQNGKAVLICREDVVLAGGAFIDTILSAYSSYQHSSSLNIDLHFSDGNNIAAGSSILTLNGLLSDIVCIERTLLNFLGRAIGIATLTAKYVKEVRKYNQTTQILDTRKTVPGYRYIDKYSVLCGGGTNHRMSLSDMILIKENHIQSSTGIENTLIQLAQSDNLSVPVQIEVESIDEFDRVVAKGAQLVMLDNFTPDMVKTVCEKEIGDVLIEVSGGITLTNIADFLHPRLNRISIGELTHSVSSPDLSMLIV